MKTTRLGRASAAFATAALATTLLAAGAPGAGANDPGATSADTTAPLTLWAPRLVETTIDSPDERIWVDLGFRAVAGDAPLEIRSHRHAWNQKITATWTAGDRSGTVPAGLQRDWSGLTNFLRVDYRKKNGKLVKRQRVTTCLNNGGERTRPDAPPTSNYPWGCPWSPFTLGSVQGIQAGWAAPLMSDMRPVRLGYGKFDVTARINPKWAAVFGLSREDSTRTTRLVVKRRKSKGAKESANRPSRPANDAGRPASRRLHPAPTEPKAPQGGEIAGPKPDLRSLPAFGVQLNNKSTHLRFSATVWNAGDSPLVVDGFRRGKSDIMDAYQYFFDTDGEQVGYQQVGELHFHRANHQHWHFQDFARYRLLRADKTPVRTSGKVSFCLANTDAVDYTVPGADWRPENTDLSTACGEPGSMAVREVLAAGSGDTYAQFRAGQAFKIEDLPNGWYWISVEANPSGRLIEHDTANNVSLRRIHLGGRPGARTFKMPKLGLIDDSDWG